MINDIIILPFQYIGKEVKVANTAVYATDTDTYKLPTQLSHVSRGTLLHRAADVAS